jgi:hypothetical protein
MDGRQISWGLSGGASVLAIGGFFWFGVSFGVVATKWGWWLWGLSTAVQLGITGSIFWAAAQLRRRSGFAPGDVGRGDQWQREATQRILRQFGWVVLAQTILIGAAVWWCVRSGAKDVIWPSIGLIVSLHFVPVARIFHVRAYYITALAGTGISLWGFAGLTDIRRLLCFGGAMAAAMWLSGWYIVRNADGIAARAEEEKW